LQNLTLIVVKLNNQNSYLSNGDPKSFMKPEEKEDIEKYINKCNQLQTFYNKKHKYDLSNNPVKYNIVNNLINYFLKDYFFVFENAPIQSSLKI